MDVVEILVTAKNLSGPVLAQSQAGLTGMEAATAKLHKTALLATAAVVGIGVEAVKMASKFDSEMTLLHTQAGVATDKMAGLKKGVLDLAGKVGQDPDSLAESLFHVESNFESMGISSKKALDLVQTAAKGATTGHADLVDVTNALTAAVASGIPGVQDFDQAMGVLNATVGVGDMKMQDLAAAFSGGMVATVKGFGLNIQDVGAALAVFGDNNIRGAVAGTQLRMSVMALANPIQGAGNALQKLGLDQDTLAKDMQKGGLKLALEDLVDRMHKAGIGAKEQGQIVTDAFGRKAGAGLNVLLSQMDRLESKYPALAKGASNFGAAWEATQQTFAFQMKALQSSFDALMITLGEKLIPYVQRAVTFLLAHKQATIAVAEATAGLLAAVIALSAALKTAAAVQALWAAGGKAVAALGSIYETMALKILYMKDAAAAAGGGIRGLASSMSMMQRSLVAAGVVSLIAVGISKLANEAKGAPPDVDKLTTSLKNLADTGKFTGELQKTFGDVDGLVSKIGSLQSQAEKMNKTAYGFRIPGLDDAADWLAGKTNDLAKGHQSLSALKADFGALDDALTGLVSDGHADQAAKDFDTIKKAALAQGYSLKDVTDLLPKYQGAVADVAAEQKINAETMGVFGEQAQKTTEKLDTQAQSAEGLQKALQALNDVQRGDLDAQAAFEAAIDAATQAVKDNGKALHERNGVLDLNSAKARAEEAALTDLAAKTDAATLAGVKNHDSWETITATYERGRSQLIAAAEAMGLNAQQATELADKILQIPDKDVQVKLETQDAITGLDEVITKMKATPGKKSITVDTLTTVAIQQLQDLGFKVTHLKNGKVMVTVQSGSAEAALRRVEAQREALDGSTASVHVTTFYDSHYNPATGSAFGSQAKATGGIVGGSTAATGGARGGDVLVGEQGPELVHLPYGSTVIPAGTTSSRLLKAKGKAGDQARAEHDAAASARGDLSISHFGQMAGYKADEFQHAFGKPTDTGSLVDALNKWAGVIKASTHGSTESRLLRDMDVAGRAMLKNQQLWDKVNSALTAAKDKLASLKDSFAQLKDSVASGIVAFGNITRGSGGESRMTVSSIRDSLHEAKDKASSFANALAALKKKGLSADAISQIAQAGIDGGGLETATALMGASKSDIKDLNSMQAAIKKSAAAAGTTTADAMYGAGIKAAEGVVKGLEKNKARIEKAMAGIATALENAIKKAIGKKATGGIIGAAGGGPRSALTWVGEQGPELVRLPFGSTVYPAGQSRAMAAAGSAGMGPLVIQLQIGTTTLGELVIDPLRKSIQTRGGNVQAVLGRAS
ncbi:phage tail tape measure protein [Peterkaempfera sp. SMS 1(5)a]|uniref:phage tail tape measure protein n=1 Tax=Peterkaempfera podocarpi TaxID=3232308 RepID=UPI0036724282